MSKTAIPGPALRALAVLVLATTTAAAQLVADFSADVTTGSNPLSVQFSDASTGATTTAWLWDFGDGSTATTADPQHTYTAPGSYDVKLTAFAGLFDSDVALKPAFITVDPAALSTSFTATPTSGTSPLSVQFSDTSSGPISGWLWTFGDGDTSTAQHPSHTFSAITSSAPALYSVSLTTFVGQQSQTLVETDLISVDPALLVADFAANVTSGTNPLPVQFSDRSIGAVEAWLWDFGDGGSSTEEDPFHVYSVQDNATTQYAVSLTVWIAGQSDTHVEPVFITVQPAPVLLAVTAGAVQAVGQVDVAFVNTSQGLAGFDLLWDFGDGSQSTELSPTHRFYGQQGPSTYDVTFSATLLDQVETLTLPGLVTVAPRLLGTRHTIPGPTYGSTDGALADMDGDGDLDLLAARASGVSFHENLGGGSFAPSVWLYETTVPFDVYSQVAPGDLDGDGDLDVLTRTTHAIRWVENPDGQASPGPLHSLAEGVSFVYGADLADVDGDGDLDLVQQLTTTQGTWMEWRAQLGGGVFALPVPVVAITDGSPLRVGDLDGDGDLDLVHEHGGLRWEENLPGDGSTWATHAFQPSFAEQGLAVADLDGDGDLDVLEAFELGVFSGVRRFENVGGPSTFAFAQALPALGNVDIDGLSTADLDQDGDTDVVLVIEDLAGRRLPGWHENLDGALAFAPATFANPSGFTLSDPELADLDGDGDLDVVTVSSGSSSYWTENTWLTPEWSPLGPRLAGSAGPPLWQGFGALEPDGALTFALSNALAGSVASLVLGASELSVPFKGGVLVPSPDVIVALPVSSRGDLLLQATWPPGLPAGLPVLLQAWIVDGAGPQGLAASNAVAGLTTD